MFRKFIYGINCNKIPLRDKGCHIIVGFVLSAILTYFLGYLYGFIITSVIGILKEGYDYKSYRHFDVYDLSATVVGAIFGAALVISTL